MSRRPGWLRRLNVWLQDRYSDGDTLATVYIDSWRRVIPRPVPWWLRLLELTGIVGPFQRHM